MANRRGNLVHATSAEAMTATPTKVSHIIFTNTTAGDAVTLKDQGQAGTVLVLKSTAANNSTHLDLSTTPAFFPNGVEVSSISSSCSVTLITTQGGAT